jgi:H+/Cl- antiporter ClcA
MISTVTTTTVSTITTAVGIAASLGLMAVLTLIAFLVVKELAGADSRPRLRALGRALNVGIIPLLLVFGAIAAAKVVEVL